VISENWGVKNWQIDNKNLSSNLESINSHLKSYLQIIKPHVKITNQNKSQIKPRPTILLSPIKQTFKTFDFKTLRLIKQWQTKKISRTPFPNSKSIHRWWHPPDKSGDARNHIGRYKMSNVASKIRYLFTILRDRSLIPISKSTFAKDCLVREQWILDRNDVEEARDIIWLWKEKTTWQN
jgi:hypothetical protein